jgi:hypothetical protein
MTDATSPPAREGAGGQDESPAVREKAQEMAGQAQEKAQETAGQAQDMLREQIDQRSTEAGERIGATAQDLRSVGEELRNQGKDTPAKLADRGAERIERLGSYLNESDADRLLSDVEEFGRRRPLAVLAGGLVVGIAAARFLKASSGNRYRSRIESEGPTRELGTRSSPRSDPVPAPGFATAPVGASTTVPEETAAAPASDPALRR